MSSTTSHQNKIAGFRVLPRIVIAALSLPGKAACLVFEPAET
jgi:hypothetical protein